MSFEGVRFWRFAERERLCWWKNLFKKSESELLQFRLFKNSPMLSVKFKKFKTFTNFMSVIFVLC